MTTKPPIFSLLAVALPHSTQADVKPQAIFSDPMVLPRDAVVPVWGWADTVEKVTVAFAGQAKTATAEEVRSARHPLLRLLKVDRAPAAIPPADIPTTGWRLTSPESVGHFSAAGYFFGRDLAQNRKIPVTPLRPQISIHRGGTTAVITSK